MSIRGLPVDSADIYFFLVQPNPVDQHSLIALFPLSQPPDACIAMAVSSDGVTFSKPVNLKGVKLGWRTSDERGRGPIEWRSTAHPVSGIFLRSDKIWIYIHEAVVGTDMEEQAGNPTRVERYMMPKEEFESLTHGMKRNQHG